MEDKKKVALNDELLDKVAGGTSAEDMFGHRTCPYCGQPRIMGEPHECPAMQENSN